MARSSTINKKTILPCGVSPPGHLKLSLKAGAEMANPSVVAEHLEAGYFNSAVLHDINFNLMEKGIYVVLGHNGAGKTTLFRTIAGILSPLKGRVILNGSDGGNRVDALSYLTHMDGIPDGMRVSDALGFYAGLLGSTQDDVQRIVQYLGISDLMNKWFNPLSEGQRKKVALARSLLRKTPINILDEPTANLDPAVAMNIRSYVRDLSRESIVLYSSHNLYEANDIGKFVILIKDGRIVALQEVASLSLGRTEIEVRADGNVEGVVDCVREGDHYRIAVRDAEDVPEIVSRLVLAGIRIREVRETGNPLEKLYTELEK